MHPVSDLRQFFVGSWRIRRRIADRRLGIGGRMTGKGVFCADAEGLRYHETGRLQFGAYDGPVCRDYLVSLAGAIAHFQERDGRHLFQIDLSAGFATIFHHCVSDCYRGRYRVMHEDRFSVCWNVEGPRKNYRMLSIHSRMADS
jgi:hypothetical protein